MARSRRLEQFDSGDEGSAVGRQSQVISPITTNTKPHNTKKSNVKQSRPSKRQSHVVRNPRNPLQLYDYVAIPPATPGVNIDAFLDNPFACHEVNRLQMVDIDSAARAIRLMVGSERSEEYLAAWELAAEYDNAIQAGRTGISPIQPKSTSSSNSPLQVEREESETSIGASRGRKRSLSSYEDDIDHVTSIKSLPYGGQAKKKKRQSTSSFEDFGQDLFSDATGLRPYVTPMNPTIAYRSSRISDEPGGYLGHDNELMATAQSDEEFSNNEHLADSPMTDRGHEKTAEDQHEAAEQQQEQNGGGPRFASEDLDMQDAYQGDGEEQVDDNMLPTPTPEEGDKEDGDREEESREDGGREGESGEEGGKEEESGEEES